MITEEEIKEKFPNISEELIQPIIDNYVEPLTEEEEADKIKADCEKWIAGESDNLRFNSYTELQYLRVKDGKIEVSSGHTAPIEFCQYINTIRHTDTEIPHDVAGFTINWVRNGNVHIDSCIYLTKEVLDAFALKHPEYFS